MSLYVTNYYAEEEEEFHIYKYEGTDRIYKYKVVLP